MKFLHKNLGQVEITEACEFLQKSNPDSYSIFVEHLGEIIEVSKAMVYIQLNDYESLVADREKLNRLHYEYGEHLYFLKAPSMIDGFRIAAEKIKQN